MVTNQKLSTMLTQQQTAEYLNISPHALAARRVQGDTSLPYVKIGKSVRYQLEDIQAYIERQKQGGSENE